MEKSTLTNVYLEVVKLNTIEYATNYLDEGITLKLYMINKDGIEYLVGKIQGEKAYKTTEDGKLESKNISILDKIIRFRVEDGLTIKSVLELAEDYDGLPYHDLLGYEYNPNAICKKCDGTCSISCNNATHNEDCCNGMFFYRNYYSFYGKWQ